MAFALEGIRVIDLTQFQQGPYATMMLADMGADVIKVEQRGTGDPGRKLGAVWPGGTGAFFEANDRNKKSITVDIRSEKGLEIVYRLVTDADVFAQNFRPGVADRLRLGYDVISRINPSIVYLTGSAFGLKGPMGKSPGYDGVGQAMSGLLDMTLSAPGVPPASLGFSISDQCSAFLLAYGAVVALLHRERTGEGQQVDTSLLASTMNLIGWTFQSHLVPGGKAKRFVMPRARLTQIRKEAGVTSSHYAKDCKPIMILMIGRELQEKSFRAMGLGDFVGDPRFATGEGIIENREALLAAMDRADRHPGPGRVAAALRRGGRDRRADKHACRGGGAPPGRGQRVHRGHRPPRRGADQGLRAARKIPQDPRPPGNRPEAGTAHRPGPGGAWRLHGGGDRRTAAGRDHLTVMRQARPGGSEAAIVSDTEELRRSAVADEISGAEAVARVLKEEGVQHVFGIHGAHIWAMLSRICESGIKMIHMRHEQSGVYAADGWARASRTPGVCFGTASPGVFNMVAGLSHASLSRSPVVAIVGQHPTTQDGWGSWQENYGADVCGPLTKWSKRVTHTGQISFWLQKAFRDCLAYPPGPVLVEIPSNILGRMEAPAKAPQAGYVPKGETTAPSPAAGDTRQIEAAVRMLMEAERPIVVAGNGVYWADASEALRSFAELARIPVHTRRIGRGAVREDHPLAITGGFRRPFFRDCDVMLVLGHQLNSLENFGQPPTYGSTTQYIQVGEADVEFSPLLPARLSIRGNPRLVLEQMIDCVRVARDRPTRADPLARPGHPGA